MINSPKLYHMQQNQIMKLSQTNRLLFIRMALVFTTLAMSTMMIGICTNSWLYTSEWLKYYVENGTNESLPEYMLPHYYKNATLGPWVWCWMDPNVPFNCFKVEHLQYDESADTTTSVEIAVRIVTPMIVFATILVIFSFVATVVCTIKHRSYRLVLTTGVLQIFTGLLSLLCLVVYVHSITREVGKKLWPETPMDEPLFIYNYGYSFFNVIASYLFTELAAFLILFVYMAKHDEQMYNRYKIRALFKSKVLGGLGGLSSGVLTTKAPIRPRRYRRVSRRSTGEIVPLSSITVGETIEEEDSSRLSIDEHVEKPKRKFPVITPISHGKLSSLLDPYRENGGSWGGSGSPVVSLSTTL